MTPFQTWLYWKTCLPEFRWFRRWVGGHWHRWSRDQGYKSPWYQVEGFEPTQRYGFGNGEHEFWGTR